MSIRDMTMPCSPLEQGICRRKRQETKMERRLPYAVHFKIWIILAGAAGLILICGAASGSFSLAGLRGFPAHTTILAIVYQVLCLIYLLFMGGRKAFLPWLQYMAMISSLLTFASSAVLLPAAFPAADLFARIGLILVQILVPLMVLADWMFFTLKGRYNVLFPFLGLLPGIWYLVFTDLTHVFQGWPISYPFLDADQKGLPAVIGVCAAIALGQVIAGFFFVRADQALAPRRKRRKPAGKKEKRAGEEEI